MTYDKDLNRCCSIFRVLLMVNLTSGGLNLYQRNWSIGLAHAIWVFCCFQILQIIKCQQETRDYARTVQSAIQLWMEGKIQKP